MPTIDEVLKKVDSLRRDSDVMQHRMDAVTKRRADARDMSKGLQSHHMRDVSGEDPNGKPFHKRFKHKDEQDAWMAKEGKGHILFREEKANGRADAAGANTTKTEAVKKIQSASRESLYAAFNNPNTDPKVKKLIEKELDDRANRGS